MPLLRAESPYVGTGMEKIAARDSGAVVIARRDGVVDFVDSERIIVKADHQVDGTISREVTADIYSLVKFKRSNQNTCINQRPIVQVGERVKKGQVIADGPCTDRGELALGRNVLVAFMPWRGYNFEDAILVSERLVKDDYYTSIHIEELEIEARDTKLGPEEITRDIPNIGENMLRDLDESGIIRIGAQVKPGSILVGKVTPKGETQLTAEEKLLRAIFGEKAGDVKDASLTCPPGIDGTVVDVQIFTRKGQDKDERSLDIEAMEEEALRRDLEDEIRILQEQRDERIYELFDGRKLTEDLIDGRDVILKKGTGARSRKARRRSTSSCFARREVSSGSRRCRRRGQRVRTAYRAADQHSSRHLRRKDHQAQAGRRIAAGRDQDGQGLCRDEAQAFASATRWPDVTVTRALSPASCLKKICRTCRTERRSRSFSIRSACRRV